MTPTPETPNETHNRLWREWYDHWHDADASKPKPSYEEWLEEQLASSSQALQRAEEKYTDVTNRLTRIIDALRSQLKASEQARQTAETALEDIARWSEAYPLDIFPEPDFKKAHELLKAGGMTLDAISASNMRHVVEGVGKIARAALTPDAPLDADSHEVPGKAE